MHRAVEQERRRQGRQELYHHLVQQASDCHLKYHVVLESHPTPPTETSLLAMTAMYMPIVFNSQVYVCLICFPQDATHSFVASPEIVTVLLCPYNFNQI
jgi:hypothetical protein